MGITSTKELVSQESEACKGFFTEYSIPLIQKLLELDLQSLKEERDHVPINYVGYRQFVDHVFTTLRNADIDHTCKLGWCSLCVSVKSQNIPRPQVSSGRGYGSSVLKCAPQPLATPTKGRTSR